MTRSALIEHRPADPAAEVVTFSLVPAIDAAIAQLGERQFIRVSEVVDLLLDLRLIATAQELVAPG